METVYIGRANTIRRKLVADGAELSSEQKQAITRVTADAGGVLLDTDEAGDPIEYEDGVVTMRLGLAHGLGPGTRSVLLTVYDAETPEGKAWGRFSVRVVLWG